MAQEKDNLNFLNGFANVKSWAIAVPVALSGGYAARQIESDGLKVQVQQNQKDIEVLQKGQNAIKDLVIERTEQLNFRLSEKMDLLSSQITIAAADRWTKSQHEAFQSRDSSEREAYRSRTQRQIERLEDRVLQLEQRKRGK